MEERFLGYEFWDSDGQIWLTLPLTELGNATVDEVEHELFLWSKVDEIASYVIDCQQAYLKSGVCGFSSGAVKFVRFSIWSQQIKKGEAIKMLYTCIREINFMKRRGSWESFLKEREERMNRKD